jgi:hypothetical protein
MPERLMFESAVSWKVRPPMFESVLAERRAEEVLRRPAVSPSAPLS